MRKRSLSTVTACAVLLGVASAGPAAAAGSARPAKHAPTASRAVAPRTAGPVTVAAYGGMAVDGALHRVFVGDNTNGTITAADYNGTGVATVSGISGVTDLAVSGDGTTLYAAATGTHEIVALNATTLTVETRYAVTATKGPTHLAVTSGKVWFSYADQTGSNLGSVDPSVNTSGGASAVTLKELPGAAATGFSAQFFVSTASAKPGVLALADNGTIDGNSLAVLDVSGATPQLTAWYAWSDGNLNQGVYSLDLVPNAPQILVNGDLIDGYANGKFTQVGVYPNSIIGRVSPDGYVAQAWGGTVSTHQANTSAALRTYAAGLYNTVDLVWAPDSTRLFVMEANSNNWGSSDTLTVLTDPTKTLPTLTATAPATGVRGKVFTVSGKLTSTLPLPSGVQLSVTRTDLAHPAGALLPVHPVVAANGSWSFNDTTTIGGPFTYTVSYAGDATHAPVSAKATINIARATPVLTVSSNAGGYAYNGWAHVTAHLGTTFNGHTVTLTAMPWGLASTNFATGTVDRYGNFSAWYKVTRNTRFSAWFGGDYFYGTAWAGRWVNGYAAIWDGLGGGSYGSAWYAGAKFQLYHKATLPIMGVAVGPNKANECVVLYAQSYYSGGWHNLGAPSSCFYLDNNGQIALSLDFRSLPLYSHFRIIPLYGGDGINAATWGSWQYLSITN